jgi:hypothetical protein
MSFKRTPASVAMTAVANDPTNPNAIPVNITEEDILKQYPWDYATLTEKLKNRYIDFKENPEYHALRKRIAVNPQFKTTRYLDPSKKTGLRKDLCNPNIVNELDKSYTRKK